MSYSRSRATERVLVLLLLPLLFIGISQKLQPGPAMILSVLDLAGLLGGGFWDDPCTWDGLVAGMTAVGCLTGNLGSCAGAVLAVTKAVKVDKCF